MMNMINELFMVQRSQMESVFLDYLVKYKFVNLSINLLIIIY